RLPPGATIGVVCPSSSLTRLPGSARARGYQRMAERGFTVIEAAQCSAVRGHTAGTIDERVDAIHELFVDARVDAVMAYWGGSQSHQLLERLDFDLISSHPKPFIGYSDITALHHAIWAKAGLVTFYGPGVITFAKPHFFDYTWDAFVRLLMDPVAPAPLRASPTFTDDLWWLEPDKDVRVETSRGWRCHRPGVVRGPLIAGNIGTMLLLHSTPWWPPLTGAVLFM